MRVGILSGTFDPIHNGHVRFALDAVSKCNLDKVYFLVEPRPRRKQGVRAFEHRVNMVQLAVENYEQLGVIVLQQSRFNVLETLPLLQNRFLGGEIYMLMGEDVVAHMADWPNVDDLLRNVGFIIGTRRGAELEGHIKTIETTRKIKFKYQSFATEKSKVSSSQVRASLRQGRRPRELDAEVYGYISLNGLYAPQ